MNVKENRTDELNLELTLEIVAADYAESLKKKLSERRRTAEFKGFRKGMVPASLIKKVYGDQCLMESVNEVINSGLDGYIEDKKLHVLGEPLSSEKQPELEWKDGNDFNFVFDLALAPEVKLTVEATDEIPSYNVTVTAKDKADMIANLKKYYEEKKEDKTDEDIDKEVTQRMKDQYKNEAEWRISEDIRNYFIDKAGLQLPEAFLKRWLYTANEGKFSKEDIEKEFPKFAKDFKWQMVRGFLMKDFGFQIADKDIQEAAESYVAYQYAMYGFDTSNLPAEILKKGVNDLLSDRKQVENLVEQVEERKVIGRIKEIVTLKPTKIGVAKFRDLNNS